ncbi:NYN domain-containing protein [Myxococcota bacterium]|nr:NYN domain-containing protein [Myxococcota bacterium]
MNTDKKTERVAVFVDGFNLYHAIADLKKPHLKWANLWKLAASYAPQEHQQIVAVYYFSAFATWLPEPYGRHRLYVKALKAIGATTVMGKFKEKDRSCRKCKAKWKAHEEKETDVNLALWLLNEARKDSYDHAFLISNDSDLAPAVRMVTAEFPNKRVRILTPPGKRRSSKELVSAAGGMKCVRTIKESRLAQSLLPAKITNEKGSEIIRPDEYTPPGL